MNTPQRIVAMAALLGASGMWLLLPRGTGRGKLVGALLALVALGLWGRMLPGLNSLSADVIFYSLAGVTIVAAAAAVSLANPVYCAIWFGVSLLGTACLFFYQGSQFLAVATVVIYAGAILVIFLFVLMLAQPKGHAHYDRVSWEALVSSTTGAVMVGVLAMAIHGSLSAPLKLDYTGATTAQLQQGVLSPEHVAGLGTELFGRHLIAVEVAGVLLLVALVGVAAIVMPGRSVPAAESDEKTRPRAD